MTRPQADPTRRTGNGDARWERRYAELARFVDEHARFPNSTFPTPDEQKLSSWILTQRNAHAGIGHITLTSERTQLLESIEGWAW
ncbi:helicase associated domain-containing protein [Microbacterium sp. NPDC055665]